MGILYKDEKDVKTSVKVKQNKEIIEFEFIADIGKFGTSEIIAGYKFTVERLLKILAIAELSDDELL